MKDTEIAFVTIEYFNNSYEPRLAIAKSMLEEAGIDYYITNENYLSTEPLLIPPTPISIELRVDRKKITEALEILKSIT